MKKASWIRPRTPRPGVRLTLECLEDRCLLAAGALDNSFGSIFNPVTNTLTSTQGKVSLQFLGPTDVETANAVAVQQDGKVVAAGNFNFNGEANQFDYAVARFLGNGQLDTTFGNGGKALVSFGPLGGVNERLNGLAIQSDGKIVVGGWALFGADEDFTAARLNTDGTLDTTFGTGGRVRIAQIGGTDNNERGTALTLQTIGGEQRIVLAGIDFFGTSDDFAAARLLPNGTLDVTFNAAGPTPGTINTTFGATDQAFAVTILPGDNSIVLGGQTTTGGGVTPNFALIKYDVNAAAAPALRAFEFAAGAPDQIRGVAAQTIGGADKIVAVGSTAIPAGSFAVARLNADLTDDTTFDTDGRQTVDFGGDDQGQAVVIQPDNKIVVAGFTIAGGLGDFAVARLTTAGALDTSFDTDGKQTVDFNGGNDRANAVALDSRLRIVLAGQTQGAAAGATNDFALARLIGQDQISTAGVYDPTSGNWFLRNSNSAGPPDIPTFAYGGAGQLAVVGDWDGDGDFTVGVYNRASGTFLLRNSNTPGGPDAGNFAFGPLNGIPVAGDWDGDGKWSIGVFDPATGNWFLRNALAPGLPDAGSFPYGSPNSKPVVGDWNGDGVWTIGVVEPDGTWKLKNVNLAGTPDFSFA
ncbi:MAG: hypothetical protein IT429_09770, partial [Gemmataceae bacterium]|nr:hypothetical protein [Gemmataceae bacterium]